MKIVTSWAGTREITIDRIFDPEKDGIMISFADAAEKKAFINQLRNMADENLCYFACPKGWKLKIAREAFSGSEHAANVSRARDGDVCRICGEKHATTRTPFVFDYGREFAHESCLKKEAQKKILRKKS